MNCGCQAPFAKRIEYLHRLLKCTNRQFGSVKSDKTGDYEHRSVSGAAATEPSSQQYGEINGVRDLIVITTVNKFKSKMVTVCGELCLGFDVVWLWGSRRDLAIVLPSPTQLFPEENSEVVPTSVDD